MEYDFGKHGTPILFSIDTRPMWTLTGYEVGLGWGGALGLKYIW